MKLLVELMDKVALFKLEQHQHGFSATFDVGEHTYEVEADEDLGGREIKALFDYSDASTKDVDPAWFDFEASFYELAFDDISAGISFELKHRHDAILILSTVVEFIKQIVAKGVKRISFAARHDSSARAKVYERIAKRSSAKNVTVLPYKGKTIFLLDF